MNQTPPLPLIPTTYVLVLAGTILASWKSSWKPAVKLPAVNGPVVTV